MGTTIFKIEGGGQRVRQQMHYNKPVEYSVIKNSDWPEQAKCISSNTYTNPIWATDLETVQRFVNEWAGKEMKLVEVQHID